jgi:mRNA interferase RelE/StbE
MNILYTKRFSKDLDGIVHDANLKKRLLQVIERIKQMDSFTELEDVRKIHGYDGYYRIRIGDYRLGIKNTEDGIEMLRLLHRKDIYRRFP